MNNKISLFIKDQLKTDLPAIKPGDIIKVYQKLLTPSKIAISKKEKKEDATTKERPQKTQIFEGQVIARKHGKGINATITVRKIIGGIGVEKTFPLHSPLIEKIEVIKRSKIRRAKLYYLRKIKGKKAKLKKQETVAVEQ